MNWPGPNDPYYLYNPTDNMARRTYYSVSGTPTVKADGIVGAGASQASYQSAYNTRNAVDSPVSIDMTVGVTSTINVAIDITASTSFSGSGLKFHTALIARDIDTTGSYAQTNYQWVMLDMAPAATGQIFNITAGEVVSLNASFPIPTWLGMDELAVIGFVQNDASKEVLNSKYAAIPLDFPSLTLTDYEITDNIGGQANGIPEAGETCEVVVDIYNTPPFATATNVTAILSTDDTDITITDGQANFPDIWSFMTVDNQDNPFVFDIAQGIEPHYTTFQLDISADGYAIIQYFTIMTGLPELIIVDDDSGAVYEQTFVNDFNNADMMFHVWNIAEQGVPAADVLGIYDKVFWHTGRVTAPLSEAEQTLISGYLDDGGKLFMSSENLGEQLGGTAFYQDYFHAQQETGHVMNFEALGNETHYMSSGTHLLLGGGAYWADSQSSIIPDAEADWVYKYNDANQGIGALSYAGNYRLLYFAFPYECISPSASGYTPRATILQQIIGWLDYSTGVEEHPGLTPVSAELLSAYPNPFNASTVISFNLPSAGNVKLAVYDIAGREAASLVTGYLSLGKQSVVWDAQGQASGVYFLKLTVDGKCAAVEKLVLMK